MGNLVMMLPVLMFFIITTVSDAAWCVCNPNEPEASLQKTLDYACGAGADCTPILEKGPCYNPDTVLAHCCWAANSYFQRKGQAVGSCDFSGTATVTTSDPSSSGCSYPSTASAAGTSGTPTTTGTPSTTLTPPGNMPPSGTGTSTGGTGTAGGGGFGGLGPSGTSGLDGAGAEGLLPRTALAFFAILFIALAMPFA